MFDPSNYANNPFAQELLQEAVETAKANTVPPEVISDEYLELEPALIDGNVGIIGPAQTGKSTAALIAAAKLGYPMAVVLCDDSFSAANFLGRYVPNPNYGINGDNRPAIWVDGTGTICCENGIGLCLEEGFALPPDKTAPLMKLLDGSRSFVLNGRVVRKHPDFRVVMTGNPGYKGNKQLNEALVSRFNNVIWLGDGVLPESPYKMIAKSHYPFLTDLFLEAAHNLSEAIVAEAHRLGKLNFTCGPRQIKGLMGLLRMKNSSYGEFARKVSCSFFNGLGLLQCHRDDVKLFQTQQSTEAFIKVMHKEYIAILASIARQNGQPIPAAAPNPTPSTSGSADGEGLLSAMLGARS